MSLESILTLVAILVGPLLAVQATRWSDAAREQHHRRISIFQTLMTTRANSLARSHVEALNAIDLEFRGKRFRGVREAWRSYLDHLGDTGVHHEGWADRRVELLVELLHALSIALRYDFDKVQLKRGIYHPRAYGDAQLDEEEIRQGMKRFLQGELVLPLRVLNFDSPPSGETSQEGNISRNSESGKISGRDAD